MQSIYLSHSHAKRIYRIVIFGEIGRFFSKFIVNWKFFRENGSRMPDFTAIFNFDLEQ